MVAMTLPRVEGSDLDMSHARQPAKIAAMKFAAVSLRPGLRDFCTGHREGVAVRRHVRKHNPGEKPPYVDHFTSNFEGPKSFEIARVEGNDVHVKFRSQPAAFGVAWMQIWKGRWHSNLRPPALQAGVAGFRMFRRVRIEHRLAEERLS